MPNKFAKNLYIEKSFPTWNMYMAENNFYNI